MCNGHCCILQLCKVTNQHPGANRLHVKGVALPYKQLLINKKLGLQKMFPPFHFHFVFNHYIRIILTFLVILLHTITIIMALKTKLILLFLKPLSLPCSLISREWARFLDSVIVRQPFREVRNVDPSHEKP